MQGKLLGGSSSINAQALIPPSASDLDVWEKLGNNGWNWQTMKPYLEGFFSLSKPEKDTHDCLDLGWSEEAWQKSPSGPVKASFAEVKEEGAVATAWIQTMNNLGYPLTDNPFDGASTGPYNGASTVDPATKTRSSSSMAYYHPIKDRDNLHVFTACTVDKLLLEKQDGGDYAATGVQYLEQGQQKTVQAAREVILCAGVFQSPKILELSGVGDPKILNQHGIDITVSNQYVGTNLQDHILHAVSLETQPGVSTRDGLLRRDPAALQAAMSAYQTNKLGPFCSSAITSFAYLPVDDFKEGDEDRHRFITELSKASKEHPLDQYRISVVHDLVDKQAEGTGQYFPFAAQASLAGGALQPGSFLTLVVALSHPLSTGTVHVASTDPSVKPLIDHRYLSNPLDVEVQARHVRYVEKIAATEPLATLLKPNGLRNDPAAFIGDDLDKAKKYLKLAGTTNYHSVGTCAMAPKESGGVVDSELRVYGVANLRIVDASIIPLVPQSNTQSLVYALAERAADIIRGRL
jgi:choline dehydrogenase-like flavoprotein